nr:hypothetical protein [Mycobacterium triplex]
MTDPDDPQSCSRVPAPASETDIEDEVAEAEARAEAARARVERLHRAAESGDAEDAVVSPHAKQRSAKRTRKRLPRRPGRPRWLRRPGRKAIAAGVGIVVACASLGASGYMMWHHRTVAHDRRLAVEFAAAARQGITTLMSIDPEHAKENVQRMIDVSTGDLNAQLSAMSVLMVKKAQDSKIGNKVTVEAVAVESLSDNSGVVLVAAKTDATGPDNEKPPPALFRLSVTLDRDGGQLKMSKIDYLS